MVRILSNSKQISLGFSKILESIKTTEDALFKHTTTNDLFFLQMPKCLKKLLYTTRAVKTCRNGQAMCNSRFNKALLFQKHSKSPNHKKKSHICESWSAAQSTMRCSVRTSSICHSKNTNQNNMLS